jgi:uncharacterized protein Smg (DUF494 family)
MKEKPDGKTQPSLFLFIYMPPEELQIVQHIVSGYISFLENAGISLAAYEVLSESIHQKIAARLSPDETTSITTFSERELQFIAVACRSFIQFIRTTVPPSEMRDQVLGRAEVLLTRINTVLFPPSTHLN